MKKNKTPKKPNLQNASMDIWKELGLVELQANDSTFDFMYE